MKPIRIQFIHPNRWFVPYILAFIACAAVSWHAAVHWHNDQLETKALDVRLAAARKQVSDAQTKASAPDPQRQRLEAVQKLLGTDLNKAFATVENVDEPGLVLRSMDVDVSGNSIRLEYELQSISQAASVTQALNAGYEREPWLLQNVAAVAGGQPGGAAQKFEGTWAASLDAL